MNNKLSPEQMQEAKDFAGMLFLKKGASIDEGKGQLAELVTHVARFGGHESSDIESILQDITLLLTDPNISKRLPAFSQRHAGEILGNLLYLFRYLDSECGDYLDYVCLHHYCGCLSQDEYDKIKGRHKLSN
ncbi:hypothetical protein ABDK00_006730 [Niabella insulamsoli]|uniref:hypothetical protein n=1 Tax=Niabella insulamsoli TaxID=3144874 RepID=UPI0031FE04D6